MIRLLTALLCAALSGIAGCASTAPSPVQVTALADSVLNGVWEGSFHTQGVYADGSTLSDSITMRIGLKDDTVSVFIADGDKWIEAMPGNFHIARYGSNAIIYGSNSGPIGTERWVESWALALTSRSHDELLLEWSRVVKNIKLPASDRYSTFGFGGAGVLARRPIEAK